MGVFPSLTAMLFMGIVRRLLPVQSPNSHSITGAYPGFEVAHDLKPSGGGQLQVPLESECPVWDGDQSSHFLQVLGG